MLKNLMAMLSLLIVIAMSACGGANPANTTSTQNAKSGSADSVKDQASSVSPSETGDVASEASEKEEATETTAPEEKKPDDALGEALDFTLPDLEGNEITLSDYRGKNVFLIFWATWCPYCKTQMPFVEELQQEGREDLVILAVSTDKGDYVVEKWQKDTGYTFPILLDHDNALKAIRYKYKVMTIPGNFLIDKEGQIVAKRNSMKSKEQIDEFLQALDKPES